MFRDLDCLGAEESKEPSAKDKTLDYIQSEGPGLLSKALDLAKGKKSDGPTPDQSSKNGKKKGGDMGGLSTGAKIGIGVGAGLAGLVGVTLLWKLT